LEEFEMGRVFVPVDRWRGEAGNIDRDAQLAGDDLQAVDVVGMLVGDENRGERIGRMAASKETLEGFFAGEAGVDQDTGPLRGNEGRVAGTGRRENRYFYDRRASRELTITIAVS
jgi:hypothetical protein